MTTTKVLAKVDDNPPAGIDAATLISAGGGASTAYVDAGDAAEASARATAIGSEASARAAADALLAPLASPALTGSPTAPTKAALDNSTKLATTAYTDSAVGVETSARSAAITALAGVYGPRSAFAAATTAATSTLTPGTFEQVDASGGNKVRKLAAGTVADDEITVKATVFDSPATHTVTVQGDSGVTCPTIVLSAVNQSRTFVWSGSAWLLKGRDDPLAYTDVRYAKRGEIVLLSTDYATVQAACDAASARATGSVPLGATVMLPDSAVTTLPGTLLLNQQSLIFKGAGPGSVLKWGGAAGSPMIDVQDSSRVQFEDMTIKGDNTNPPSHGIYFESPSLGSVGTNEYNAVRRVLFGRGYTNEPSPNGAMGYAFMVGGAFNGNNDQFFIQDCGIHDVITSGINIANTQSIWGQVENVVFNACATGLEVHANVQCRNLQFNRNTVADLKLVQGRCQIDGFYSENAARLWDQGVNSWLSIKGGKGQAGALLTDGYWAKSTLAGNLGSGLHLEDLYVVRQTGTSQLFITGSSSDTNPAKVYLRGNELPDGTLDVGYVINGYAAGTPLWVDIQQGSYRRQQLVQSLNPAGQITPVNSYMLLGPFYAATTPANQAAVALTGAGVPTTGTLPMIRAGCLTGITVKLNVARTAGTATFQCYKNGNPFGAAVVIDGTNTSKISASYALGSLTYAAGDTMTVRVTTDALWAPTTPVPVVMLELCA